MRVGLLFRGKEWGSLRNTLLLSLLIFLPSAAWGQVKLNTWTLPSQGFAPTTTPPAPGTDVNLTGSGFPSGTISPGSVTITVADTCGSTALATTTGIKVTHILSASDRVEFMIPAVASGTYEVSLSGTTTGGSKFSSLNCSKLTVLPPRVVLSSCLPSSSLGVLLPPKGTGSVTAYVPNGSWDTRNRGPSCARGGRRLRGFGSGWGRREFVCFQRENGRDGLRRQEH